MGQALKKQILMGPKLTLKEVLGYMVNDSLIDEVSAQKIFTENKINRNHPLSIISQHGVPDRRRAGRMISIDELTEFLANKIEIPYIKIDSMSMNIESIVKVIPYAYASRLQILPIFVDETSVVFASAQPRDHSWVDEIKNIIKKDIIIKFASPTQIKLVLDEIFVVQKTLSSMQGATIAERSKHEQKLLRDGKIEDLDKLIEIGKQKRWGDQDSSVVKIVDWLINFAYTERASDIHMEPKKGMGQIRFRVDGKLKVVYKIDPEAMLSVISRIKILSEMKLDEKRKPQDGRIKRFLDNGKKIEMRVSSVPTYHGEKIVMRIFDQTVAGQNLDFIGFNAPDVEMWNSMIHSSQGLVLVTGPTGSGKTTTLYTSLNIVATEDVNVCSVEDPIEMNIDSINQIQVNPQIGLTFAESIRSFLRQDPDIIMVGEIRDYETAESAIQASLTGHLVFSTVHTNGALATIQRLIDLGLPSFLINSSLKGILAQRLVRRLCPNCKEKIPTPKDKWNILLDGNKLKAPEFIYKPAGCNECKNTGYVGRLCVYELVEFTDDMKKIIHQKIEMSELKEKSRGLFVPFRVNCAQRVIEGETSLEEVLEVAY
ncbi:MAG: type II secretion system protein E [Bdellovibrio sp. CG12_big_fil_rev_8_21_14_0_65_39_13]|nr:MAG: type II secretion system protein E [Bdellovibrio sp. CG22_combo_CG10-13_8_21_14_all_39_27]PIQ62904.1 MAG: type II secretion system protein E [Bdellovibrio sp. CG12_big_fil_rev_8_21_14_0_65_39_13]PIR33259.1 MAG: type II secretion system protein E [Bdellovibrio sp. CG11_big_fil_rev_8_21_14_0_20_39_38]